MTPWVQRLLIANIAVFFLQQVMPAVIDPLVFVPALALARPWTFVTYMFLHAGIGHIFFNMFGLYIFGPRVETRLGSQRFVTMYFLAGIGGAVFGLVFPPHAPMVGASAGIYGVMLAFAYFWPRDQIYLYFFPVEARWFVMLTSAYSLYNGITDMVGTHGPPSGIAHFAHLGGYAAAFLYLKATGSQRQSANFKKRAVGAKVPDATIRNWQKIDTSSVHALNKEEINRILDKINSEGIDSLTPQDRMFLSNFVPMDDRTPPVS